MKLTHHKKEVVCSTKGKKHQPPTSQSAVVQGLIHLLFHVRNKKKKKKSAELQAAQSWTQVCLYLWCCWVTSRVSVVVFWTKDFYRIYIYIYYYRILSEEALICHFCLKLIIRNYITIHIFVRIVEANKYFRF